MNVSSRLLRRSVEAALVGSFVALGCVNGTGLHRTHFWDDADIKSAAIDDPGSSTQHAALSTEASNAESNVKHAGHRSDGPSEATVDLGNSGSLSPSPAASSSASAAADFGHAAPMAPIPKRVAPSEPDAVPMTRKETPDHVATAPPAKRVMHIRGLDDDEAVADAAAPAPAAAKQADPFADDAPAAPKAAATASAQKRATSQSFTAPTPVVAKSLDPFADGDDSIVLPKVAAASNTPPAPPIQETRTPPAISTAVIDHGSHAPANASRGSVAVVPKGVDPFADDEMARATPKVAAPVKDVPPAAPIQEDLPASAARTDGQNTAVMPIQSPETKVAVAKMPERPVAEKAAPAVARPVAVPRDEAAPRPSVEIATAAPKVLAEPVHPALPVPRVHKNQDLFAGLLNQPIEDDSPSSDVGRAAPKSLIETTAAAETPQSITSEPSAGPPPQPPAPNTSPSGLSDSEPRASDLPVSVSRPYDPPADPEPVRSPLPPNPLPASPARQQPSCAFPVVQSETFVSPSRGDAPVEKAVKDGRNDAAQSYTVNGAGNGPDRGVASARSQAAARPALITIPVSSSSSSSDQPAVTSAWQDWPAAPAKSVASNSQQQTTPKKSPPRVSGTEVARRPSTAPASIESAPREFSCSVTPSMVCDAKSVRGRFMANEFSAGGSAARSSAALKPVGGDAAISNGAWPSSTPPAPSAIKPAAPAAADAKPAGVAAPAGQAGKISASKKNRVVHATDGQSEVSLADDDSRSDKIINAHAVNRSDDADNKTSGLFDGDPSAPAMPDRAEEAEAETVRLSTPDQTVAPEPPTIEKRMNTEALYAVGIALALGGISLLWLRFRNRLQRAVN